MHKRYGDFDIGDRADVANYGTIDVYNDLDMGDDASFDNFGGIVIRGDLEVFDRALVTNAGTITVVGDADLAGESYTVVLGDGGAGSMAVTGELDFDSALRIELADGFAPEVGEDYEVFSWGSIDDFSADIEGLLDLESDVLFDPLFATNGLSLGARDASEAILGGAEDDVLVGGAGNEFLFGGAGGDEFHFGLDGGSDVVVDFGIGDSLVFEGFGDGDVSWTFDQATRETLVIGDDGTDRVEVTLRAQEGTSYSVTEQDDDTVVTLVTE